MSTIEQAGKRLEQLRNTGVEVPWAAPTNPDHVATTISTPRKSPQAASPPPAPGPKHKVDIDLVGLEKANYIVPQASRREPRNPLIDQFRSIKRPLLAKIREPQAKDVSRRDNLIMITSSIPGEGKTFTAINLAMSIAMEVNQRVTLVDADTVRMTAARRFGLEPRPGLLDLLAATYPNLSELVLATNVDNLSFLPAGTESERVAELFSSESMRRFIDLLAQQRDHVFIFDAPPLLPSVEARALATQLGQIVLVVQAGKTGHGAVQHALSLVENCPEVTTLLNQSLTRSDVSRYGYYAN